MTRVTRRVPHVEQELLTLPENMSSPPVFSGVRFVRSLVFCIVFCGSLFVILSFIVLSDLLQFTASDCHFGIFKLFFNTSVQLKPLELKLVLVI